LVTVSSDAVYFERPTIRSTILIADDAAIVGIVQYEISSDPFVQG
jgi:hypothetical protein